jgi:general stress protein 26
VALKVWGGRHLTREEIVSLLKEVKIARFCSLNDDGTIHAVPVWFKYDNDDIVIVTPASSRKVRNLRHNKNVSIIVDTSNQETRGVLIYGTAEITELRNESEVKALAQSICEKYMSKEKIEDQWRVVCPPTTSWAKVIVKPKRMVSFYYPG